MRAIERLRWWMIFKLWPRRTGWGTCANRTEMTTMVDGVEHKLVLRDTRQPDGYERTELLQMLRTVRRHEHLQGWKVPEPDAAEICGA